MTTGFPYSLLFAAGMLSGTAHADEITQIFLSDGELNYVGYLDEQANKKLFALYDSLNKKPTVLSIRSKGGEVGTGMDLGTWVRERKLDVKVMEFCLSSCANYVFPAAARKIVSNLAVVGFHGGVSSETFDYDEASTKRLSEMTPEQKAAFFADAKKTLQPLIARETVFFKSIGVRQDITTYGQGSRPKRLLDPLPLKDGWTYSLEDFGRMGVDRIKVINPPWMPVYLPGHHSFPRIVVE